MKDTKISFTDLDNAYFIGIGGIGMSALARYFKEIGWRVSGYDKVETPLTINLISEGIDVHYDDLGNSIAKKFELTNRSLIVYTPAIPEDMRELTFVLNSDLNVFKRAEVLGMITRNSVSLAVAGTHGKTTTSAILANVLSQSSQPCNAFLGGIANNFESNYIGDKAAKYTVIEADEFDRSFLNLNPYSSIITSTDEDHLDIYSDSGSFIEGFQEYANRISSDGVLVKQVDVEVNHKNQITYAIDSEADVVGYNLRTEDGQFLFDVRIANNEWKDVELGIPGIHNTENALACIALAKHIGLSELEIRNGLKSFKGVLRRFHYHYRSKSLTYIDDYAHHPTELKALISSIRLLYPNQKIIGVFQPHLYSRTRDFMDGFINELEELDELILMPIYPAREAPIEGVTSVNMLKNIDLSEKSVMNELEVIERMESVTEGVVLTIGAGDIDRLVKPLSEIFINR